MGKTNDKSYYRQKGICLGRCSCCFYVRKCADGLRRNSNDFEFLKRLIDNKEFFKA